MVLVPRPATRVTKTKVAKRIVGVIGSIPLSRYHAAAERFVVDRLHEQIDGRSHHVVGLWSVASEGVIDHNVNVAPHPAPMCLSTSNFFGFLKGS